MMIQRNNNPPKHGWVRVFSQQKLSKMNEAKGNHHLPKLTGDCLYKFLLLGNALYVFVCHPWSLSSVL